MASQYNTTLTTLLRTEVAWSYDNALDNSTTRDQDTLRHTTTLADGVGESQADVMWHDRRTVTLATGTDDIDLAGPLEDVFGQSITFDTIKAVLIVNNDTTAGEDLKVGGAGAAGNAWATLFDGDQDALVLVKAGGALMLSAPLDGYAVTAGTADILRIVHDGTNSGADINYDIVVVGTT